MKVSGSKLPLLEDCQGAAALPWFDNTGPAAKDGTALHRYCEVALQTNSRERGLATLPEDRPDLRRRAEAIPLEEVVEAMGGAPEPEVAYAWDPVTDTGNLVKGRYHRDYRTVPESWIATTVDVVRYDSGTRTLHVGDYKTGLIWVEPPDLNLQLRFQALAGARALAAVFLPVDKVVSHLFRLGRERTDAMAHSKAAHDLLSLDAIAGRIRDILRKAGDAAASLEAGERARWFTEGEHCRYCPGFARCPIKATTVAIALREEPPAQLTPQLAGRAWIMRAALQAVVDRVGEDLDAYLRLGHEIPLPDGRVVREVPVNGEKIDAKVAMDVLQEMLGDEAVQQAVTVTKAGIDRALVGRVGFNLRAVMDRIRQHGGVVPTYSSRIMAVRERG